MEEENKACPHFSERESAKNKNNYFHFLKSANDMSLEHRNIALGLMNNFFDLKL